MPRVHSSTQNDFRQVLREKAFNHSLFYMKLSAGIVPGQEQSRDTQAARRSAGDANSSGAGSSEASRAEAATRASRYLQPRVSDLVRCFEPHSTSVNRNNFGAIGLRNSYQQVHRCETAQMQYLRPPRPSSPSEDISSSDEDDRAAVRRRSRDLSDDSAVEIEPRTRRHSHPHPRVVTPLPMEEPQPRRDLTLVEAHMVELGRRNSEVQSRCVRTPSVVVSDYSDGAALGTTDEELKWLRAKSRSIDSACSSCSTLSSREEEEIEPPQTNKKIVNMD